MPELGIRPSREEFHALARNHSIVPVLAEFIADTVTPVGVLMALEAEGDCFLLESVEGGDRWGRYSFVGCRPLATIVARDGTVSIQGPLDVSQRLSMLGVLDDLVGSLSVAPVSGMPPLHSGFVGALGWETVREIERLESSTTRESSIFDSAMMLIGDLVAFDHWRQSVTLLSNVLIPDSASEAGLDQAYDQAVKAIGWLFERCGDTDVPLVTGMQSAQPVAKAKPRITSDEYQQWVSAAKELIHAGDIFQVVLSQRFDIEARVNPLAVYRALRLLNPSPYLYFFAIQGVHIVGSSPEAMVRVRDGVAISRPIAGSRPRGDSDEEDLRLSGELLEDPKEIAEHVMLVDLARNDLGRICEFGTQRVDELMVIERYSHIMHLTSQVSGSVREGLTPIDVLRATFPAGTLSGAPKVRAMEIIDDLEPSHRGLYGGAVGYIDLSGNLDMAIAIRTMVVDDQGAASVQAGAGIVADSDPESEDRECHAKSAAILAAVAASTAFVDASN